MKRERNNNKEAIMLLNQEIILRVGSFISRKMMEKRLSFKDDWLNDCVFCTSIISTDEDRDENSLLFSFHSVHYRND